MISLKAFIAAVHSAVLGASDALMQKNVGLIEDFFEESGENEELRAALNGVLSATTRLTDKTYTPRKGDYNDLLTAVERALKALPPGEETLRSLLDDASEHATALFNDPVLDPRESRYYADTQRSIQALHDALYQPDAPGEAKIPLARSLRPKAVVVEFPSLAPDGSVKVVEVHVPLITLVPLSMSQVKEAKLKTAFELHVEDTELHIGFPGPRKKGEGGEDDAVSTGRLEITIGLHEPSEGLKTVVDAYDQTLRAQIPH